MTPEMIDPSRTGTLRRKFAADLVSRFTALKTVMYESIVKYDCLGLRKAGMTVLANPAKLRMVRAGYRQFDFPTNPEKVDGFMRWLRQQSQAGIMKGPPRFTITRGPVKGVVGHERWTDMYIESAYKKGVARGNAELKKLQPKLFGAEPVAGVGAFLQPVHADAAGMLAMRAYEELDGINAAMSQQIGRVLAGGLLEGKSPLVIARELNDRVDKIGITRAKMLARTEIMRAHHMATINTYEAAGIEGVKVKAEFSTAGDAAVCELCEGFEREGPMPLEKIRGLIPAHPNCRCVAIPVAPKLTKKEVEKRVRREVRREAIVKRRLRKGSFKGVAGNLPPCISVHRSIADVLVVTGNVRRGLSCLQPKDHEKVQAALKNANPAKAAEQRIAKANERWLAKAIGDAQNTPDNRPFDVIAGVSRKWKLDNPTGPPPRYLLELKSIVISKKPGEFAKITMNKHARMLKAADRKRLKVLPKDVYTVAFDTRTGSVESGKATAYIKKGYGNFQLRAMVKVGKPKDLVRLLKKGNEDELAALFKKAKKEKRGMRRRTVSKKKE